MSENTSREALYHSLLQQYWGYDSFRQIQLDIIRSVDQKGDTLGLMPTGGGKSITYQVYGLSREGTTVVITPLISLMQDQVENLLERGIKAVALHSGLTKREMAAAQSNVRYSEAYKFLYVSPERLNEVTFQQWLRTLTINLWVVDEAHCISKWGHDFRPSYLNIKKARKLFPQVPVLALTATATEAAVKDIIKQLEFKNEEVLRYSFLRKNIRFIVKKRENKMGYIQNIFLQKKDVCGIVYVARRRHTMAIVDELQKVGISAAPYHAGMSSEQRAANQEQWIKGNVRIMVATNAFGMGIDKPNVRYVIHYAPSASLEAYYQEAGRAGRDGRPSVAILLHDPNDISQLRNLNKREFPPVKEVKRVYEAVANYLQIAVNHGFGDYSFSLNHFCSTFKISPYLFNAAVKILRYNGYIEYSPPEDSFSLLMVIASRESLYRLQQSPFREKLLTQLFRKYMGLFTSYVRIDEEKLARSLTCSRKEVYEQLKLLSKQKIIHYIPKKEDNFISFLIPRVSPKDFRLKKEAYAERKEQKTVEIKAMVNYITQKRECRMKFLLDYFGEKLKKNCQSCDICLQLSQ